MSYWPWNHVRKSSRFWRAVRSNGWCTRKAGSHTADNGRHPGGKLRCDGVCTGSLGKSVRSSAARAEVVVTHTSKMLLRYGGLPKCWSNRRHASAISSNWRTRASASRPWKNITPIDVATAKSTMLGACIDMESQGGSCHNGWELKNFPLMQKGNLRNKFIWFPFATMSSKACCKTRHHCKKQTRNQSLFEHEMRTWFCSALHGLDTRCDIQEPGKVSFLKVCCAFALHTRFGYWKLSKSRASLICFRRLR